MIVKNEERYIRDCLESIKDVADQLVIIDTGCTDDTIRIAGEYNAEVHSFKWIDDFSAARNASIKYARNNWILWLDADERLKPESIPLLKEIISRNQHPVIYNVQIENETNDAADAQLSTAYRLFPNNYGIGFKNRIHEQLTVSKNLKIKSVNSQIILKHLGYALQGQEKNNKDLRNLFLLEKMVGENPADAYTHYTYGQQLSLVDNYQKALIHFEKAYALKQFDKALSGSLLNVLSETYLKLNNLDKALYFARKSIQNIPNQTSAYYMVYRICEKKQEFSEAIAAIDSIIKNNHNKDQREIATDVVIDNLKLVYTKAVLHEKNQDYKNALQCWKELLTKQPAKEELYNQPIAIALNQGFVEIAQDLLEKLIVLNPSRTDALDALGTLYIKRIDFKNAILVFEKLNQIIPDNQQVIRKLAGLYLKTGSEAQAAALLS
ncbi:MAG: glycosyltransferase [Calditrichae bacterium]|nr:glycosyltransferase [Calditrichia bacterium]